VGGGSSRVAILNPHLGERIHEPSNMYTYHLTSLKNHNVGKMRFRMLQCGKFTTPTLLKNAKGTVQVSMKDCCSVCVAVCVAICVAICVAVCVHSWQCVHNYTTHCRCRRSYVSKVS